MDSQKNSWTLDDLEGQNNDDLRQFSNAIGSPEIPIDEFHARRVLISSIINYFNQKEYWYRLLLPITRNRSFIEIAGLKDRDIVTRLNVLISSDSLNSQIKTYLDNRNIAILIALILDRQNVPDIDRDLALFWIIYSASEPMKRWFVNNPNNQIVDHPSKVKYVLKALALSDQQKFIDLINVFLPIPDFFPMKMYNNLDDLLQQLVIPVMESGKLMLFEYLLAIFTKLLGNVYQDIIIFIINNLAHSTSIEIYKFVIDEYFQEKYFQVSLQNSFMMFYAEEMARYVHTQFIIDRFHDNKLLFEFIRTFYPTYRSIYNTLVMSLIFFREGEEVIDFERLRDDGLEILKKDQKEVSRPVLDKMI